MSNGKVLWGGVGSGKTRVAVAYYLQNEAPKNVYVITTAKKRDDFDWQKVFYQAHVGPITGPNLGGREESTGRSGNGVRRGGEHRTSDAILEPRAQSSNRDRGNGGERTGVDDKRENESLASRSRNGAILQ